MIVGLEKEEVESFHHVTKKIDLSIHAASKVGGRVVSASIKWRRKENRP